MSDRFVRVDMEKLSAIIEGLDTAFRWDESTEGHDYWRAIFLRLREIRTRREAANQGRIAAGREMIAWDLCSRAEKEAADEVKYQEWRKRERLKNKAAKT